MQNFNYGQWLCVCYGYIFKLSIICYNCIFPLEVNKEAGVS